MNGWWFIFLLTVSILNVVVFVIFLAVEDMVSPPPVQDIPSASETRTDACVSRGGNPDQCTLEEMKRVFK